MAAAGRRGAKAVILSWRFCDGWPAPGQLWRDGREKQLTRPLTFVRANCINPDHKA